MREFHWLPKEIEEIPDKKMRQIMFMMTIYNRVQNAEMERASKSSKGSSRIYK